MVRGLMSCIVGLGLLLGHSGVARPCSCLPPRGAWLTPSGPVPREARGVVWSFGTRGASRAVEAFQAERIVEGEAAASERFGVTLEAIDDDLALVIPSEPLRPGERWRFTHRDEQRDGADERAPEVIEIAVTDVALRELATQAQVVVGEASFGEVQVAMSASCSAKVPAVQRTLALELPAAARGLVGALLFETTVDGEGWRPSKSLCSPTPTGRTWQGIGQDLVYAACRPPGAPSPYLLRGPRGLATGKHIVAMRARLPGTDIALRPAAAHLELVCP